MKNNIDAYGYVYYFLYKNKKAKRFKGHRLVAETFIDNPYNLPMINHKDENKSNNAVSNLEWCSATYNLNYGNRSKKYTKPIRMLNLQGVLLKTFESMKDAEKETSINHSKISSVCHGKRKKAGGYIWEFV